MRDIGLRDIVLSQRYNPELGGSITWLQEVYSRWPKPVELITHNYGETKNAPEQNGSISLTRSDILMSNWGLDSWDSLKKYWRMLSLLRPKANNARLHCTHLIPEALPGLALGLPIISYAHGEEILACQSSRQLSWLYKLALKRTSLVIANSENTARLVREFGQPKALEVVHPGVNYEEFQNPKLSRAQWREEQGLKEDEVLLLTVGRLCARKNQLGVIRALKNCPDNIKYIVLGTGPGKEVLEKEIKTLGLTSRVKMLEPDSNPDKISLYNACDIFVMPAIQVGADIEGFGITFIEAAACGLPSISGNIGGQPEAVKDGETGLVVDGAREEEIVRAICELASNPELRAKLGASGKSWAKSLDWERVVEKTVQAISLQTQPSSSH